MFAQSQNVKTLHGAQLDMLTHNDNHETFPLSN